MFFFSLSLVFRFLSPIFSFYMKYATGMVADLYISSSSTIHPLHISHTVWQEFDEDFNVKSHGYVKCENMSPMLMIDGEQNTAQRNTIHTDTEPNKDYVDDCEQIADDDAADKDLLHDDSSSNILKRMPDVQSQVRHCWKHNWSFDISWNFGLSDIDLMNTLHLLWRIFSILAFLLLLFC